MAQIPLSYYQNDDVVFLAQDLLGKLLVTQIDNKLTAGIITETEAYRGLDDKAAHSYNNKRTARTEIIYARGGVSYVYLCYGIHKLFNIVIGAENVANAILIRAIEPIKGIEHMLERRNKTKLNKSLSSGPGTMSQALGITMGHNAQSLNGPNIWLEHFKEIAKEDVISTIRIGVDYANEDALLPWRFYIKNNLFISKK